MASIVYKGSIFKYKLVFEDIYFHFLVLFYRLYVRHCISRKSENVLDGGRRLDAENNILFMMLPSVKFSQKLLDSLFGFRL
jgi:hypothetical protein